MLENSYKKDKSVYTEGIYADYNSTLQKMRAAINIEQRVGYEIKYIKEVIVIVEQECNKELSRLMARIAASSSYSDEYKDKLRELTIMWADTNRHLKEVLDKQDDINVLERASNDMCKIKAAISSKDFRTYNMIPIWDIPHQPTGLNALIQNYELILDDYLNTLGSKGLDKFDKTRIGYEKRQLIDEGFEKAVISEDLDRMIQYLNEGAYIDLQLNNSAYTALNYALINKNQEMMEILLENGASANIKGLAMDKFDRTFPIVPITYALQSDNFTYISKMLENGAKIDKQSFEKILRKGDDILIERVLNQTKVEVEKEVRIRRRFGVSRDIKNYLRRTQNVDIIIKMYNNKLLTLNGMNDLFMETHNTTLLRAMDQLGYEFDFLKLEHQLIVRIIVERNIQDGLDFVLEKFHNIDFESNLKEEGNIALVKINIERNANVEMLEKIAKADNKLNVNNFNIQIPNDKLLDLEYMRASKRLKKLNANISYQSLGINKRFDALIEKMVRGDKTYKQQKLSERELVIIDENGSNIGHYIAAYGDLEDLQKVLAKVNLNMDLPNAMGYTPLAYAIYNQSYDICNSLLHNNTVNLDRIFENENTYLHYAVQSGNLSLVRKLMENGTKFLPNIMLKTPLHISIELHKDDIAKELIGTNCDINMLDQDGKNALMYASQYGNCEIAKMLLEKGIKIDDKDAMGNTALFMAVKSQDIEMIRFLISRKADINVQNELFETPLMYAVKHNLTKLVNELIECGANLVKSEYNKDMEAGSKKTVLHYANNRQMRRMLMINGANPYQRDGQGEYPFDVEELESKYRMLDKEINNVAFNKDKVDAIIEKMGEDINTPNPYRLNFTAVSYAAYKGNIGVLERLIKNGGDVNICDNGHTDALMTAVIAKKEECAMYLIEKGANLNHVDRMGNNALMISIYNGLKNVAKAIISRGVGLQKTTKYGNPLSIAIECKEIDIIKELIDKKVAITEPEYKKLEELKAEYKIGDKEYLVLDNILKTKATRKDKGLGRGM